MLDYIVRFLNWLSNYLQKKEDKTSQIKSYKSIIFSNIFTVLLSGLVIVKVLENYWYNFTFIFFTIVVNILLVLSFFCVYNRGGAKYFFLGYIPVFFGMISYLIFNNSEVLTPYFTFLNILLVIFPLIFLFQFFIKKLNNKYVDYIKNLFLYYNVGFIFFTALNIFFISIGLKFEFILPWSNGLIELISSGGYINGFFEGLFYTFILWVFLLLFIYSLHIHFDYVNRKRSVLNVSILIFLIVYLFGFTGGIYNIFLNNQIVKATRILSENGETQESYKKAKVFMLETAFLNQIKQGYGINTQLFEKLFDSTPEAYYGEKIGEYTDSNTSFATNSSKIGEKADVVLTLGEIENKVKKVEINASQNPFPVSYYEGNTSDLAVISKGGTYLLETTYRFNLSNLTTQNQEAVIFFEAPSKNSVVTSLRLGLDLELNGQIAPVGAARKVYEESLRKNTDPALIEKVGIDTYSLRIFPVTSITDSKTQGRQLVEVKILSPIGETDSILYSPKLSFMNIKTDKKSSYISKVYNGNELIKEDIIKDNEIKDYLGSDHYLPKTQLSIGQANNFYDYCLDYQLQEILYTNNLYLSSNTKTLDKTLIFFDNSSSVEKNKVNRMYENIYSGVKNYAGKLNDVDAYTFNFDVNKIASVDEINYWGYSNTDRIISYLSNNNISYKNIIIVTDDNSFNMSSSNYGNEGLTNLASNRISVIKIGNKIKTYKPDFNILLSASYGNIYTLNDVGSIDSIIKNINEKNEKLLNKNCITQEPYDENLLKIQAGYVSNILLSNMLQKNNINIIANVQTQIAQRYGIVNQFNSLIALENSRQQYDLNVYSESSSAYDSQYNNYSQTTTSSSRRAISSGSINSGGISFGAEKGSFDGSIGDTLGGLDYDYGFSGSTKISIFGLIIILGYLLEYIGVYNFLIKYIRGYNNKNLEAEQKEEKSKDDIKKKKRVVKPRAIKSKVIEEKVSDKKVIKPRVKKTKTEK